jgi:aryl-alcohol dehydrogenase-like predicted oxidoreductase
MAYRRLGRTRTMISEVASGGDPIRLDNFEHLDLALEMGLNSPGYNKGDTEKAYGNLMSGSSRREKVFLATKVSSLGRERNELHKEIFDGLPAGKQATVLRRGGKSPASGYRLL